MKNGLGNLAATDIDQLTAIVLVFPRFARQGARA